ncbi:hypothetical protein COLO4_17774 [Corchorus olitorius]|uniref:Pentacotripeptide-repeat region of PRORP domain-containing protein n=1 Tax=Corchorus olitorius TaxID=93759 RepID=A0A1R3JBM1_9ROSI|nr:hypothetical protein COLO4_17774 [Corchorus olitorius]
MDSGFSEKNVHNSSGTEGWQSCGPSRSFINNFPSSYNMKAHKVLSSQILKREKLKTVVPHKHSFSFSLFSSTSEPITSDQSQALSLETSQTPSSEISPDLLIESVRSSQWHFIKHLSENLDPSLISTVLFNLHKTPELALQFTSHIGFNRLDVKTRCLAIAVASRFPSPKPTLQLLKQTISSDIASMTVIFNELALARDRCGNVKKAFRFFDEMLMDGIQPTHVTYTSLIYVLSKRNRMKEADDLFERIISKGVPVDVVMFNALIDGHCANGNMERAYSLLKEMDKLNVPPDDVTYNTLMQGHCREGRVEEARELLHEMKRKGIKPDHVSYNTLISGYSRKGDMKDAMRVRDEMLSIGFNPTLLTYNALIQGFCKNHEGDLAEDLLKEMVSKGITPDDSTYLSLIEAMGTTDHSAESSSSS